MAQENDKPKPPQADSKAPAPTTDVQILPAGALPRKRANKQGAQLVPTDGREAPTALDAVASIPEEAVWLASHKSERTRRAYRKDVQEFMKFLGVSDATDLRASTHAHVIAWENHLREVQGYQSSTVRRRLAAISSLFRHLKKHGHVDRNPAADVKRPPVNRREGSTAAFSKEEARALLDAPSPDTVVGLRDRAILSVGLHAGLRRAEIAHLAVGDLYTDRGFPALRILRKGGRKGALAINPTCENRIRAYLEAAGISDDPDAPMFLPTAHNRHAGEVMRHLDPDTIDRVVKRHAGNLGLNGRYSAHSMRATFITTALDNGSPLEDVQRAAGHADPNTTKLYDRRGYDPERSASFFANY